MMGIKTKKLADAEIAIGNLLGNLVHILAYLLGNLLAHRFHRSDNQQLATAAQFKIRTRRFESFPEGIFLHMDNSASFLDRLLSHGFLQRGNEWRHKHTAFLYFLPPQGKKILTLLKNS